MKIILVAVLSVDGKSTQGENPNLHDWISKEDESYFSSLIQKSQGVVMGRKTYDAARPRMSLKPNTLRWVMTRNPERHANESVPGQLEFSAASPEKIVAEMANRGFRSILLVGGAQINGKFLKAKLVDEFWITIEPRVFGQGKGLVPEEGFDLRLQLKSVDRLNRQGTLLLKYGVVYQ